MARRLLSGTLLALAIVVAAPAAAQARTPCAVEASAPSAANLAPVSDAVFCLTNQIRASFGLALFRRDARLDAAARLHSQDMASRNFFAHVTPEGLSPTNRAAAQGYTQGVGENIAYGYDTARAVMLGWMASAGHCRNILGVARDIGVGTANPALPYYTQNFGDYAFGSENAAAAGCPYNPDLDALVVPDLPGLVTAGPATTTSTPVTSDPVPDADVPSAPALGRLGLSTATLRAGGRGSVISYTLSAPATVRFRIERRSGGRWRTLPGALTDAGDQGANSLRLRARLRGRTFAPGRYRLRAIATDADGSASPARRVSFRVVGR
jgi:uncharacterized protein YkwD